MTQDAYSPLTGRWGVEGIWDVAIGSAMVALLGVLVLALATSRWHRVLGAAAILMLVPNYVGFLWLGGVQVSRGSLAVDCLLQGPVDYGTRCGAEYLHRYVMTAVPVAVQMLAFACLLVFVVRSRLEAAGLVKP